MAGDINLNAAAPCPSCGRCPTCGRGGYEVLPYLRWPYPYATPYWSIIPPNGAQPMITWSLDANTNATAYQGTDVRMIG